MILIEGTKVLNRAVPSFTVPGEAAQYLWSHGHAAIRFISDSGVRDFHFLVAGILTYLTYLTPYLPYLCILTYLTLNNPEHQLG